VHFLVGPSTSRQNSWREHKHAVIRVSALRKGPAADGGRCRASFTFRYPVDGNRACRARYSSLSLSLSLSLSFIFFLPFLFLFSFVHLDTSVVLSLRKVLFPAQFFLRVETKQLYETNASRRRHPCSGKGRPPRDQRGRGREETLTRTKNRCIWSFRLHASRAHVVVVRNKTSHLRETRYGISSPTSPTSMHACRACHSRAQQYSRGKYTKWSLQENSGLSFPNKFGGANFSPAQVLRRTCHCEITHKTTMTPLRWRIRLTRDVVTSTFCIDIKIIR